MQEEKSSIQSEEPRLTLLACLGQNTTLEAAS